MGLGVSTLQDPSSKNLRVGHPPRLFNFCKTLLLDAFIQPSLIYDVIESVEGCHIVLSPRSFHDVIAWHDALHVVLVL